MGDDQNNAHTPRNDFDLETTINDSQLALNYAASKGISLDKDVVEAIVQSRNTFSRDKHLDISTEQKFWPAFSHLMVTLKPATVESIKFCATSGTQIKRNTNKYRYTALITLIIMVCFQIYWIVGSGLIADYKNIPPEINRLKRLIDDRSRFLKEASSDDIEISNMESDIINMRNQLLSNSSVVSQWNAVWRAPVFLESNYEEDKVIQEYKSAIFALQALETYILPLLYGLLGAFAFVLRKIAVDTHEGFYTRQSNLTYVLRLNLGALAGLAIGWFLGPKVTYGDQDLVRGLSPLALAFLGGYSVDILFSVMDRIIGAVSSKDEKAAQ